MSYGTGTLTRTETITMVDVRHVAWRIETDLRTLRVKHGRISAEYEQNMMHDLMRLMYGGYIDRIDFNFTDPQTGNLHRGSVRYSLTRARSDDLDSDAGGLQYFDSTRLRFNVLVNPTAAWRGLSPADNAALHQQLRFPWPSVHAPSGSGTWVADRSYGHGMLGASRQVYRTF